MTNKVRVRFAPSPTGPLHIGGIRTAIYNHLLVLKHGGDLILRIEDTDTDRTVPGAYNYILDALHWVGVRPTEGYGTENQPHGSYVQSERTLQGVYDGFEKKLLDEGRAYVAFDTPEELSALGNRGYGSWNRMSGRNSLTIPADEVHEMMLRKVPHVVRAKVDPGHTVVMRDLIRGTVKVDTSTIDDKVLVKSNGMPTYHLAATVDDMLMDITHVLRGEEWLPSAPLHVLLHGWLGNPNPPEFAHLPLILRPDGQGKLSKRDGELGGFPVFPLDWTDPESGDVWAGYRESGYMPEAVYNMLAMIGWHPPGGDNREVLDPQEIADMFTLDRVSKGGGRFNPKKALWFNRTYMARLSDLERLDMARMFVPDDTFELLLIRALAVIGDRLDTMSDLASKYGYLFGDPVMTQDALDAINGHEKDLMLLAASGSNLDAEMSKEVSKAVRAALTGSVHGPRNAELLQILGRDEVGRRLVTACNTSSILQKTIKLS